MSDPEIIGPGDSFDDPFDDRPFDEPRPGMSRRAKLFAGGAIAVGLIALVAVGWFAFQQGIRSGAEDAAPVIRAAPDPIKRKPVDPGGLDVPHQDKLVFNRLAPGQVQEPVERLLPPPEEPSERPPAPVVAETAPSPALPEASAPEGTAPADLPERVVEALPSPSAVPAPETAVAPPPPPSAPPGPAADAAPAPEVAAAPPAPATPFVREAEPEAAPAPAKPAAGAGTGWKIQLAAVSSEANAKSEWARMQSKNADLLGSLALNIQTIKLDRGTFYRIQAGPLADGDAARALCGKLKTRSQDCLIVAP